MTRTPMQFHHVVLGDVELIVFGPSPGQAELPALGDDEAEVAMLIADGHDDFTIARLRKTTVRTAREQRRELLAKLEVPTSEALSALLFGR